MFEVERFVEDCHAGAVHGSRGVLEVVARAVATPGDVIATLGGPRRAGVEILHRSAELTVLNLVWGPRMCQLPHNHAMWAVIGIYTGREDSIFWRRPPRAGPVASRPPGRER